MSEIYHRLERCAEVDTKGCRGCGFRNKGGCASRNAKEAVPYIDYLREEVRRSKTKLQQLKVTNLPVFVDKDLRKFAKDFATNLSFGRCADDPNMYEFRLEEADMGKLMKIMARIRDAVKRYESRPLAQSTSMDDATFGRYESACASGTPLSDGELSPDRVRFVRYTSLPEMPRSISATSTSARSISDDLARGAAQALDRHIRELLEGGIRNPYIEPVESVEESVQQGLPAIELRRPWE